MIEVGQVRFDTKRFATRLNFGVLKKQIILRSDLKRACAVQSVQIICQYFSEIHA